MDPVFHFPFWWPRLFTFFLIFFRYMSESGDPRNLWKGKGETADAATLLWRENDLVFMGEVKHRGPLLWIPLDGFGWMVSRCFFCFVFSSRGGCIRLGCCFPLFKLHTLARFDCTRWPKRYLDRAPFLLTFLNLIVFRAFLHQRGYIILITTQRHGILEY